MSAEQRDLFDVPRAKRLRDDGISRAARHAGEQWQARAFDLFKQYALTHDVFMTEDVRAWAHARRLIVEPPDRRAWGAVAVRAKKLGVIAFDHIAQQRDPKSHRSPGHVWRVVR
jgi:hypothetical protein